MDQEVLEELETAFDEGKVTVDIDGVDWSSEIEHLLRSYKLLAQTNEELERLADSL